MISIPSVLKTRTDYIRALEKGRENDKHRPDVIAHFKGLIQGRQEYVFDKHLDAEEIPDGERPDYIVTKDEETGMRTQLVRQESPTAKIFQLGFTVAEVQGYVDELEAQ